MNPGLLIIPVALAGLGLGTAITAESGDAYVERVVDGDTVVLGDGSRVRLIGIDAPESDEPCGEKATEALRKLVEHRVVSVGNPESVQDRDRYGRLLRYLDTDVDPAASLLSDGLAAARYDSTDGYDPHPREAEYHALEAVAVAACPTLDRDSRWFGRPDEYEDHVEKRRLARIERDRRREQRAERREARRERREARREARLEREEAERIARELERIQREAENDSYDVPDYDSYEPDGGYTGPRCYDPGGVTWHPC